MLPRDQGLTGVSAVVGSVNWEWQQNFAARRSARSPRLGKSLRHNGSGSCGRSTAMTRRAMKSCDVPARSAGHPECLRRLRESASIEGAEGGPQGREDQQQQGVRPNGDPDDATDDADRDQDVPQPRTNTRRGAAIPDRLGRKGCRLAVWISGEHPAGTCRPGHRLTAAPRRR